MNYLLLPVWFGLLAWPLMGGSQAAQVVLVLFLGGLTFAGMRPLFLSAKRFLENRGGSALSLKMLSESLLGFQKYLWAGGTLLLLILPFLLNNYYLDTLNLAVLYALLALGLNITVGYTGLLDLGYAAFYGVGAYLYALLSTEIGLSFWLGLPLGGLSAAFFGLLLGVITLRLRGDYLAIITLGFVQITYLVLNNWDAVTQGPNGIMQVGRPKIAGFVFHEPMHFYYLTLLFLLLTAISVHRLLHSQIGRAWRAIREDEVAAEAMGIDTTRMKVLAFSLGAGIAGVGGVFFAARYSFVSPESFTFLESVRILSMVVLGGMGSLPGVIVGAFLLTILPEVLRGLAEYRMLIFGAALVVMMVFRPQGLFGQRH